MKKRLGFNFLLLNDAPQLIPLPPATLPISWRERERERDEPVICVIMLSSSSFFLFCFAFHFLLDSEERGKRREGEGGGGLGGARETNKKEKTQEKGLDRPQRENGTGSKGAK